MPKMKWGADFDELPEDWEDSEGFEPYEGPVPPANKLLRGSIKKMWAGESSSGNDKLVVLFEAEGNTGENAKYNGWSTFDHIALTPGSNWRYGPLLEVLGVTLRDVKSKTLVAEDDDNVGTPIKRIGTAKFPASCGVITKSEGRGDEREARVGKYSAISKKAKSRRAAEEEDGLDDDDVPF